MCDESKVHRKMHLNNYPLSSLRMDQPPLLFICIDSDLQLYFHVLVQKIAMTKEYI